MSTRDHEPQAGSRTVIRQTLGHKFREHLIADSRGTRYLGIFREGGGAQALWVGDDWDGFKAKWKELEKDGLRLVNLEIYGPSVS